MKKRGLKTVPMVLGILCLVLGSCKEIFLEDDISSAVVEVLAPTDSATLSITEVNFTWEPVEFADQYHLQIAVPNFAEAQQIVEDTLIAQTSFLKTLTPNAYEWRVRAVNSAYQTIYTTQAFAIEE